jgi:hypothetical protein
MTDTTPREQETDAIVFARVRQTPVAEHQHAVWRIYRGVILGAALLCLIVAAIIVPEIVDWVRMHFLDDTSHPRDSSTSVVTGAVAGVIVAVTVVVVSRRYITAEVRRARAGSEHEWLSDLYWVSQGPTTYLASRWSSALACRFSGHFAYIRFPAVIAVLDLRSFDAPEEVVRSFVGARLPHGLPRGLTRV